MAATYDEDEDPARESDLGPYGEAVDPRDEVEEHEGRDRGLVVQELHAGHLELAVVAADPNGVERGGEDAKEGEDDTNHGGRLDGRVPGRAGVVVRDDSDAGTGGDQREHGTGGELSPIEHEVHQSHARGEKDAGDLVEGDRGEGEGEVGEDDVQAHGDGEGDEVLDGGTAGLEEGEAATREDVKGEPGDEEVEGREGELEELEAGVGEDGLVGEDNANGSEGVDDHPEQRGLEVTVGRLALFDLAGQQARLLARLLLLVPLATGSLDIPSALEAGEVIVRFRIGVQRVGLEEVLLFL